MKSNPIYIISHSHWDREWYFPFQVFRTRLLYAMDRVLELLKEFPELKFHLDGQVVIIEDYLEVLPQREKEIFSRIREGRIKAGPFYVLPDELLISGETAVRNFLVAQSILKEKSLPSMDVGYFPDMFGHSAYIPTLVKGLGMSSVFIWRGVGDRCRDTEFIWRGPDGSEVLAINMINNYANFTPISEEDGDFKFVEDYEEFKKALEKEVETLLKHSKTKHVLLMTGRDQSFPSPLLVKFVRKLREEGYNCRIATLDEYAKMLQNLDVDLRVVGGEFRGTKYAPLLKDVLSTRIYLKQKSHLIERSLTKVIEPMMAVVYLLGAPVDLELLRYTWKLFLKTLPHDSICGCSTDQVHREMSVLQDQALQLIQVMRCKLMHELMKGEEGHAYRLAVFSPFARKTRTIVEKEMYLPLDEPHEDLIVVDEGKELPTSVEYLGVVSCVTRDGESFRRFNSAEEEYLRKFLVFEIPGRQNIKRKHVKIRFEAELPPMGFKIFDMKHGAKPCVKKAFEGFEGEVIETPFLRVSVNKDGTLNVEDRRTGRIYRNLMYFEDDEDVGDEYNYCPSKNPEKITTLGKEAKVKGMLEDALGFSVEVEHELELPECFDFEHERRSEKKVPCPIKVIYFIHKSRPRIDVKINLENNAKDHRLRVHFKLLPVSAESHVADDYFGPVERPNRMEVPEDLEEYVETPANLYPMQNFVYMGDEKGGMVVSTKGLKEYEISGTELSITVLRSVGMISRSNLSTRKESAAPEMPVPEAQCLGPHLAELSLYFTEKYSLEEAYNFSETYQGLPVAFLTKTKERRSFSMLSIEPDSLILSAFKVSEDREGIILRLYNITDSEVVGNIRLGWSPEKVERVNMAENSVEGEFKIERHGKEIRVRVKPHEVVTLKL